MKNEFFKKVKANLNAAQMCFDNEFYDASANRAYYAVFQAAIAALSHRGIKRGKADYK
ncbi:MAG: HEPN domain-containing protein [Desulfobacterales bacterium]|nr:HEPN domain-containing protein [Desulfobacterales bacterium]